MKKILKYLLIALVVLILAIVGFYFWAKSPTLPYEQYKQEISYKVELTTQNDSIITVMSYNIGYLSGMTNNLAVRPKREFYKENETLAIQYFSDLHPDIVGFQEIDYGSKRSYEIDQHKMIAENLYPYTAKAVNWDKRYVPFPYYPFSVHFGKIVSGQSIMSKYPIVSSERIVLEDVASQPFYYKAMYLNRLLQIATIKHPFGTIFFMNVHAEAFDQQTRAQHINFIYDKFWELAKKGPVILVGDFNSDPTYKNSAVLKFLNDKRIGSGKIETTEDTKGLYSYPSDSPKERLDYIFYTKSDFEIVNSKVFTDFGMISDHLPYVATLKFIKNN
ncbi:endonuclease/exonuclease/phosphatase family metal-dependent hydrolase [Balneicella halophila]|uniref:Endonuclease/exonuclease/phosphatase family metal-dependent hydrolase n=1 Tax=Balneicella halophila TaxID=1537566 RepID=A0A7L4UPZ1_BALHA|nr:endonuclease/exonuclease/phosphatase family protein [Balneicella halophila]PVX51848.1 endonuclease/exonuclease/phosphatase family metal-dependent hydrolase [Balneicella halophila]